jgi:hypothetical protein
MRFWGEGVGARHGPGTRDWGLLGRVLLRLCAGGWEFCAWDAVGGSRGLVVWWLDWQEYT